jgi:hypothetical protein
LPKWQSILGCSSCPNDETASSLDQSINSPQICRYLRTNTSCPIVALLTKGISLLHTQRRTALSNQDNAVSNLNSKATPTLTVAVPQLLQHKQLSKRHQTSHELSGDTADWPYTDLPVASHSDAYRITCINPPMENPTVTRVCDEQRKADDENSKRGCQYRCELPA